jgi:hypothetical protein
MVEKSKPSKVGDKIPLIEQARWIVERYELVNDVLITRGNTLLGFTIVEIGLLFAYSNSNTLQKYWLTGTFLALISAVICFLVSNWAKDMIYPDFETLINASEGNSEMATSTILKQILRPDCPERSLRVQLKNENRFRGKYQKIGLIFLAFGQFLLLASYLVTNVIPS